MKKEGEKIAHSSSFLFAFSFGLEVKCLITGSQIFFDNQEIFSKLGTVLVYHQNK